MSQSPSFSLGLNSVSRVATGSMNVTGSGRSLSLSVTASLITVLTVTPTTMSSTISDDMSPTKSISIRETTTKSFYVNRNPSAVSVTRVTFKLGGSQWNEVLQNETAAAALREFLLSSFADSLGLPKSFVVLRRLYVGSLVAELEIRRNETYPISDSQLAYALNTDSTYEQALTFYTAVTGDVSVGLLEPVVLIQVVEEPPACGEVCIGLASGGSVLLAAAGFSLWYILCYKAVEHRGRKKQKPNASSANEPVDESDTSETDSEPFNETVLPPREVVTQEPFDDHHGAFDDEVEPQSRAANNPFGDSSPFGGLTEALGECSCDDVRTVDAQPRNSAVINVRPPSD